MAGKIPVDTPLTDRDLLLHALQHIEEMHEQLEQVHAVLEQYRPLLARFFPAAQAVDAIAIMQAAREGRRNGQEGAGRRGGRRPRLRRGGPAAGR